jgi:hypothetical protein
MILKLWKENEGENFRRHVWWAEILNLLLGRLGRKRWPGVVEIIGKGMRETFQMDTRVQRIFIE